MMKEDKYIDQIFHDKLADYEKNPPAFVWDNIEAKLSGEKHRKLFIYWRVAGVAAALLIAFVASWQFIKDSDITPEMMAEKTTQQPVQNEITVTKSKNSSFVATETPVFAELTNEAIEKTIITQAKATSENAKAEPSKTTTQKIEKQGFIESLQAVLKSQELGAKNLAEKDPLMEKVLFSAEELRIIEENKTLLAMNTSTADQQRWMVGAAISPVYSVSQSSQSDQYAKKMATPESNNNLNMAGGLSFEYKTQKKWSFQSGVYYNKLEQASSSSARTVYTENSKYGLTSYFSTPVSENKGKMEMNSVAGVIQINNLPSSVQMEGTLDRELTSSAILSDANFNQNFEYLEIPLFVKYQLVDSKVGVQVLSGVSTNILVGNNVYLQDNSGRNKIGKTDGMVDFNYSGVFGLGLNYSLTSNLFLNIEPRFKYYFNSLNEDSDLSYKPYTFGIYTGISYSF